MPLKMVAYFSEGINGWSEVYYTNHDTIYSYVGNPPKDFVAESQWLTWFIRRRACLVNSAALVHVRVTDMAQNGVFATADFSEAVGVGKFGVQKVPGQGAEEVYSTLLINMVSGVNGRRRIYFGGIPTEVIVPPQAYVPSPVFSRFFLPFMNLVSAAPYTLRSRPKVNPLTDKPITDFQVNPDGRGAVVFPSVRPAGDPTTWYVLIRGLKAPVGWNGVHLASVGTAPLGMNIGPTRSIMRNLPPFAPSSAARVVLASYSNPILTDWDVVRVASRRRGRPFGVSRGRRSRE